MTEQQDGRFSGHPGRSEALSSPDNLSRRGWIFYDGDCRHCTTAAQRFRRLFARRGFEFVPLQTPWVQERLGLNPNEPIKEMRLLTVAGDEFGGIDAIIFLTRQLWWGRPFYALTKLPGIYRMADRLYRWVAAHRGCTHLNCNP